MKKHIHVGDTKFGPLFVTIEWTEGRLSLSWVEGPKANGDATGSCGQITDTLAELVTFAPGYDEATVKELARLWKRWHLNDMKAGCEHQRAERWDERPIDPSKPTSSYGRHFEGQTHDSWNMLTWVTRKEHPQGLLGFPCPVCGYKYGSQWLREEVPAEVIEWLFNLPEGEILPMAWAK